MCIQTPEHSIRYGLWLDCLAILNQVAYVYTGTVKLVRIVAEFRRRASVTISIEGQDCIEGERIIIVHLQFLFASSMITTPS